MEEELFVHPGLSRKEADELVLNPSASDGTFLVRSRPGEDKAGYIMCVVFRGQPTHHKIEFNADGFVTINNSKYGDCRSLRETVELLSKPFPKWPVVLGPAVLNSDAVNHGFMKRKKAEEYLEQFAKSKHLQSIDGIWFLRKRSEQENEYIIVLGFQGKVTHHLVIKEEDNTAFSVNNTKTGCSTLNQVIRFLATKPKMFPVGLPTPIPKGWHPDGQGAAAAAAPAAKEPKPQAAAADQERVEPAAAVSKEEEERNRQQQLQQQEEEQRRTQQAAEAAEKKKQEESQRSQAQADEQQAAQATAATPAAKALPAAAPPLPAAAPAETAASGTAMPAAAPPYEEPPVPLEIPDPRLPRDHGEFNFLVKTCPRIIAELYREDTTSWGFGINSSQPPSVTSVVDDGIAYHAGLYPGDVIVHINNHDAINNSFESTLGELKNSTNQVYLEVLRPSLIFRENHQSMEKIKRMSLGNDSSLARQENHRHAAGEDGYYSDE